MRLRAMLHAGGACRPLPADNLDTVLAEWRQGDAHLWLDVEGPDAALLARLSREFLVHPAALASALRVDRRAQLKEHRTHFFLALPVPDRPLQVDDGPAPPPARGNRRPRIGLGELDIFCGRRFVLTLQPAPLAPLQEVWERFARAGEAAPDQWPGPLLYSLCDAALAAWLPHLDWLEDEQDRAEQLVFAGGRTSPLGRIFALKRLLLTIRRILTPIRDIFSSMARRDFPYLGRESGVLFTELYDRALRILDLEENLRNLYGGLVDAHLTVQNTRMNEVLKVLTVIATIMMPLTVITGFFGMNFAHMPLLGTPAGFWSATAFMGVVAVGMAAYFKRKGWW